MSSTPGSDDASEASHAVARWIERCRVLAESTLDSVETPADELAELAAGDRQLMEDARKVILAGLDEVPGDPTWSQMLAFWRRAFEKGTWSWEPNPWDASPMLTA
ncbi:MAG: hypothetical protein ABSE47_16580 [Acidimicrobiales bacterium]|jgi:hypothetical protein